MFGFCEVHVLKLVQWCLKVHVLDVGTGKTGTVRADNAIPEDLG